MSRPYIYQEDWPKLVSDYLSQKLKEQKIPTQAELSYAVLSCDEDTITNYIQEKDKNNNPIYLDFYKAVNKLKTIQKHMLIEKGLEKTWHAGVVNLLLSFNHGINNEVRDNDDSKITGLKIEIINNSDR